MSCERQIPYAVMNWRILIEEDFFFVDHTRYLHDLEKCRTPVFLRPKRFGKSLRASSDPNSSHGRNEEVVIVEAGGNRGYNWFEVRGAE